MLSSKQNLLNHEKVCLEKKDHEIQEKDNELKDKDLKLKKFEKIIIESQVKNEISQRNCKTTKNDN
jgi:hypothetical protein